VDVYVLLDVLLVILIALFIPIGFWRGAYREAFVTLGILFGASLGRFWGESWGTELSNVTRLHESGGAFMIAMLCLISATFLLGYSSGAAIPVPDPGWVARTLGALIAGANGALLLSFALRDIRVYLLSSDESGFLDNAVIAPFLSDGTGWILLVGAAVFVPIALVLALFGADYHEDEYYDDEYDYEYYEEDYPDTYAQRTMQLGRGEQPFVPQRPQSPPPPAPAEETRPVPTPQSMNAQHASQQEPTQRTPAPHEVETQRRASDVEETQPHRPQPSAPTEPDPEIEQSHVEEPDRESETTAEDVYPQTQPQVSEPEHVSLSPTFGAAKVEETTDEHHVVFGHQPHSQAPREDTNTLSEMRCPNCQEDISNADVFCPRCGERI
jgi:uncharacterized membrane protein required for colicin V production